MSLPPRATRCIITLAAAALLPGCTSQGRPDTAAGPVAVDTTWYVSVRARDENGRDTRRLADSLEYGMVMSTVRINGDPLAGSLDIEHVDSVRLTASTFAAAIRAHAESAQGTDSLVVLMVHGFGTSLHEAWQFATAARTRSRSPTPWVVFCWPSNGAGIAWPRADQILLRAYREDSVAAAASRSAFSHAARTLLAGIGGANLAVVAHSMGSQLVGEAFAGDTALRRALVNDPLRALAFVAPDVPSRHFGTSVLPAIRSSARRVVVYAASNDRMLRLSRSINDSERAGLIRGKPLPFSDVEFVDATAGLLAENRLQRVVGAHHAIKRASAAIFDLQIVTGRYAADCRATLGTAVRQRDGVWTLTATPPPPLSALAACAREGTH